MRYVTVKEMKELDIRAIKERGVSASLLMENAGKAIAAEAMKTFVVGRASRKNAVGQASRLSFRKGRVFIFCGYGNNGGDGFVAARHLLLNSYPVETFLVGNPKPFSPETQENYRALVAMKHTPAVISDAKSMDGLPVPALVIDAIFGIGIRGVLDEFLLKLIDRINGFGCPVIAADVPSGLDADTGKPLGAAVKATKTVTMGYPKIGFQNPAAKQYLGELICADIGLPQNIMSF